MTPSATMTLSDDPHMVQSTINYQVPPARGGVTSYIPGSAGSYRRKFDIQSVQIHDIRGQESNFSLIKQGFQLCKHTSVEKDFRENEKVKSVVYPEIEKLLMKATGATKVHVFSHITRRDSRESIDHTIADLSVPDSTNFNKVMPARFAHIDQSEAGAFDVLNDNMPPEEVAALKKSRWSIINVWRPIRPIHKDPLAVCDARSVLDEDLIPVTAKLPPKGTGTFEDVSAGKGFDTLQPTANPDHRWYYASGMTPEEVLFIKCYDSKKTDGMARRVPHCAFTDPTTKDDTARESIEVRCLVFYENQPAE